jgi:hypothetical protein
MNLRKFFAELKRRQRLQSRDRLRSRRLATDAGRESDFSVLRNSELGRTFWVDNNIVKT